MILLDIKRKVELLSNMKNFCFTVRGRPVPYTRSIKGGKKSSQEKKYFAYCNHVWSECLYTMLQAFQKAIRIEDVEISLLTKIYVREGIRGDTDNYGKAIKDALQDRKGNKKTGSTGEKRLFYDDKQITFDANLLEIIDSLEHEKLEVAIFWPSPEILKPITIKNEIQDKKILLTGNTKEISITLDNPPEEGGIKLLKALYDSQTENFGSVFKIEPPDTKTIHLEIKFDNCNFDPEKVIKIAQKITSKKINLKNNIEIFKNPTQNKKIHLNFSW